MTKGFFIEPLMTEAAASVRVTPEEFAAAQELLRERRRREFLTWRAIVRRELGDEVRIAYDAAGAPAVLNCDKYIGVAHCPGRVAVCISDSRCAVDIEPESRDFSRAAARYMSPREQALSADPLLPGAVWCAKETLYKYAGRQGLDLLRDLHVEEVDFGAGKIIGRIEEGEPLSLGVRCSEGFIAVYIL